MALKAGTPMKKPSSARRILPVAVAFGLAGTLALPGTAPALAAAAAPAGNAAFADPAHALGTGWSSSSDEVVTGVGDSAGFHILVSRERDAYQWTNLVTLDVPELDMGAWTGELCTTGDDKYAVAVYAPSAFSNHPELMEAGAFASVVNLATGAVTPVAAGIQLAYHTPGCGAGDTAVLTRALGDNEQETQVLDVDAAAGKVTAVRTVRAQITNAVPTGSGDDGLVGGSLVHLNPDGSYGRLATLPGAAYGLVTTSTGIDTVTVAGGKAVVDHWDGHSLRRLGTGDPHNLALFQQDGGGDLLVGAVGGIKAAGTSMRTATATRAPDAVSRQGGLLVDGASDEEVAALVQATPGQSAAGALTGRIDITAHAAGSAAPASGLLIANGPVATSTVPAQSPGAETDPQPDPSPAAGNVARPKPDATVPDPTGSPGAVTPQSYHAGGANPAAANDDEIGVPLNTLDESIDPTCLIPRNSPTDQALQPTSQMVEWAADQESDNNLTVQRPTDFLGTQLPAYQPEQMFPLPTVAGETQVDIPAQVLLGIFDQESNFDQASWHAVAGDGGNPLISDYYGTAYDTKIADNDDVVPDYAHTDCGYGVGQVTSGMSSLDASPFTNQQATAVATDYAANVAASGQILAATWNQLASMSPPMLVNDGNPTYIENWFMAIWGYNSGVYPESEQGANGGYGVGWFNNPANPNYPADRSPFLDETTTMNDAANPQLWTYEEKVMGWIAYPQLNANGQRDFADPFFPSGVNDISTGKPTENLPMNTTAGGFYNWCTSANSCSSGSVSNPCPADSSACWWHLPVSWISNESSSNATVEGLDYALGSSEPAMVPKYAADCPNETAFKNQFAEAQRNVMVVPNLNDPSDNTRGCSWGASDGKFTLRLGDNVTLDNNLSNDMQANPLSAQIDTHQIGSGFLGHFYFTHSYDSGQTTIPISGGGTETYNGLASNSFVDGADNVLNTFVPSQVQHQVVGSWTPDITPGLSGEPYEIYLSIPDHGASEPHTVYHIDYGENAGSSQGSTTCAVSQSTGNNNNTWVLMGSFELYPGADVWLTNMLPGGNGSADVSYGAMVFVPVLGQPSNCVDSTANLSVS
jgi:hypothetical protein